MKRKIHSLLLTALMLVTFVMAGFAQIQRDGTPPSVIFNYSSAIDALDYSPNVDVRAMMQEDEILAKQGVPERAGFVQPVGINMTSSGVWTRMPGNRMMWQVKLQASNAKALGVVFENFYIPDGAELYLYDDNKTMIIGAFTSDNNNDQMVFSTHILPGTTIWVEYVEPMNGSGKVKPPYSGENSIVTPSATIPQSFETVPNYVPTGSFTVTELIYVYRDYIFTQNETKDLGDAESCQVNINCSPVGDTWQSAKRGVARILFKEGASWYYCSGTLVNNTALNGQPYFLTANHCGATASAADKNQWQFYFNYERPGCPNTGTPANNMITGCSMKATGGIAGGTDFMLVLLNSNVSLAWNPYFNGWDRTTTASTAGVSIHHPSGDAKKISTYSAALTTATWSGGMTNGHWRVVWAANANGFGCTEGGSSGSPIFNGTTKRVVGTLTGGSSTCASPATGDYYGKFNLHWEANGTTAADQLKPWLDPMGTNPTFLDGYDPNSVSAPPVANFSATPLSVPAGTAVQFTDLSTNYPTQWSWTFTGGYPATSTDRNPTCTWVVPGTYTVSLTATNAFGSHTVTKNNYITVTAYTPPTSPVTIGTGTSSGTYWPFGINTQGTAPNRWVRSAAIYTAAEIGGGGTITQLAWQPSAAQTDVRNITIYMKHTTAATFAAASTVADIISDATQVYSGTFTPNATTWFPITLQTPFIYNGGNNLMVIVLVNTTTSPGNKASNCYYTTKASAHQQWTGAAEPTVAGTINGNRPNLRIAITPFSTPVANFAGLNPIITEDFEGATFPPAGWLVNNVDGAGSTWAGSTSFNHTNGGSRSAAHVYSNVALQNGYLITPQITAVPAGAILTFWSYNEWPNYYGPTYQGVNEVRISTTGTAPADFSTILWSPTTVTASWVQTAISLASYSGQNIYLAFRYGGNDAHSWFVDDVSVSTENYTQVNTYEGDPLTIFDKSTNSPTLWQWTNTGGVPSTQYNQNANLVYNVAGLYNVSLKAANPAGQNTKTVNNFVNVIGRAPVSNFAGKGNFKNLYLRPFIPVGGDVDYTDKSTRVPTSWSWTFEAGTPGTSTTQNPQNIAYSSPGIYDVTLYTQNAHGNNTGVANDYIIVGGRDTITNLLATDNVTVYSWTQGLIPGHCTDNTYKMYQYAEYFENAYAGKVYGVSFFAYRAQGTGKNVTFYVWDGSTGSPGTVIASKTVPITSFTQGEYSTMNFNAPVNVTGSFFVGYLINYDATHNYTTHQFCTAMSQTRPSGENSTGWASIGTTAPGTWMTFTDIFGESGSMWLDVEFEYDFSGPTCTVSATPGCGTGSVTVTSSENTNQTFHLTDNAGTILQSWTGTAISRTFTGLANGTYRGKVVIGAQESPLSASVVLTNTLTTAITTQPLSQTVCPGANVTFTVVAQGASLTYQWRKGGVNIAGATTATYSITGVAAGDAGNYDVVVTGTCGTATSNVAVLTVNAATAITTQPVSQTVCAGAAVNFSVTATGTALSYQWRKGGVNIGGATSATYTIPSAVVGDAGSYDVVVTGTCGVVTSATVTLTVNATTAITVQPVSQTVCAGTNVTFSVTATGSGLTYQWRKGGSNIGGATASSYTITGVVAGDAGSYDVVVTGACGTVTSTAATLTVNAVTVITAQPTSQTVCAGTPVTFTVTATGTGLSYQWRKNGTNIGGATSATYTIASAVAGDAGNYDVVVSGTCGNVNSAVVTLTVNAVTAITTQPLSQTVCAGTNVTFTVVATGSGLTYQWRKGGVNIGGATSASYTITGVTAGSAGSYDVVVTGACGTVTSTAATLTVNAATAITTQPLSQTVCAGTNVTFSVTATGTGLTYQWRKGGVNIGGATSATYTITGVAAGDAGNYDVVVNGTCGNVTSSVATLTVNAITAITTQPLTQTVCAGTNVAFTVTATGAGLTYQWRKGGSNIGGATSATYTITGVAAGDAGNYDVVVTGTCGNVTSNVAVLTVNANTAITTQPLSQTVCAGTNVTFTVAATGTGLTYQWRKGGANIGGATAATYTITGVAAGDAGNYDVVVTGACGNVTSAVAVLTVNANTAITTQPLSQTVCAGTNVTFSVTATGTGLTYQWRKGVTNIGGATSATYTITGVAAGDAGNYTVVVTGTCGTVTSNIAVLTVNAVTAITTQPLSQTVCPGASVTFSVTATGTGLAYQWRKGGSNIGGATSASYTIPSVAAGDAGSYDVVVTGTCGNVTSASATLTVNANVAITTQPVSQTVCPGSSVTFSVVATGTGLTYQWRKGGTNIGGATSASYTIASAAAGDAGSYDVIVTGTCGSVTSAIATLTVNANTAITTQPLTQTVCAGTNVTFTVAANGTTLTYQWRKGGTNIPGATSATYTITGVSLADAGNFDVVVTGACGTVTSNVAVLTVNANTVITAQPSSQTACIGTNVTFTVVATGTGLTYQWRKGGSNIGGATSATYTISGVVAGDAGNYDVVITGACGNVTSAVATLTISATLTLTSPTNQAVCPGATATFTVIANGSNPTYLWKKNGTAMVNGGNIAGVTTATLTISNVAAGDVAAYTCDVTSDCGNATSVAANLTLNAATAITTQPSNQTVCAGANASFTVVATGSGTLTYQWQQGGVNIPGANAATFTITGVTAGAAGNYTCVVTADCGNVTSTAAVLAVNAVTAITTQPVSETICEGQNVTLTVAAAGAGLTYQWRKGGTNIGGATSASYAITGATLAAAGNYDVVVTGTCGTVTSNVAVLTVNANVTITTQPASLTLCAGDNANFSVVVSGTVVSYQWRKGGSNISGATSATYTISGITAGDAGSYDVVVTGTCGNVTSSAATLTVNALTVINTQPVSQTVCEGDNATLSVVAAGSGLTYQWQLGGVNITGATTATYTIIGVAMGDAGSYTCIVTGSCATVTSTAAVLTVNANVLITDQPDDLTVCAGDNASFTVAISGTAISYQWRKGGSNIAGATSATYTISGITAGDAGSYDVVITGPCGNVTSAAAVLTVNPAVAITTQPLSATVCEGANATLTVVATGSGLTYQWQLGGVNITGAIAATYSITGVAMGDAGNYTCIITGDCGTVTSSAAVLTVNANVLISDQPVDLTLCTGDNATFSVNVTGTATAYQWRKDGTNITGATSSFYTISGITAGDAGSYDVVITGPCGNVTSTAALLTVNAPVSITTQPSAQAVCDGADATFTVVAAGSGITYQWQFGGTDVTGATSATLTITGATASDAGSYTCVITGACGTVTTASATLTINAATAIVDNPSSQTVCEGSNVTFTINATGEALAYHWYLNGTAISGAIAANLTLSGVTPADAGDYTCEVTGACGMLTSSAAALTVDLATVITTQPLAVTLCEGGDATFTVVATGTGISYQWRFNTVDITGANAAAYTITGAALADAGSYDVVITGSCGVLTSDVAILTVNEVPQLFVSAVNASCGASDGSASVSVVGGTGTYTYLWSDALAQTTETATGLSLGTYYVTVNDGNCTAVGDVDVAENGAPVITIDPVDPAVCEGLSVTITANGADAYVWTPALYLDNANTGVVVCTPEATTTYTVTGTTAGCSAQAQVTVTFNPLPVAGLSADVVGYDVTITDLSSDADTWEYNMGDGTVLTDQSPVYTYTVDGVYYIVQTVTNSCGSDMDSVLVDIIVSVPFAENGIFLNLYPNPGNGICNLEFDAPSVNQYTLRLINHAGQIVYTETFNKESSLSVRQLNFSNQAKGVYRLQVLFDGKALQTPLIINRY
jgi:PKD repeat protein